MSRPNVFVLSADSLRLDRTLDPDLMPFLSSLGGSATRFTNAVSNGPFTPASFPALVASRYASSIDGVGLPASGGVTTLAEELSRHGYRTAFLSDNEFVGTEYNYDRGYDEFDGYEDSLRDTVREHVSEDGLLFAVLETAYMYVWQRLKDRFAEPHYYATAADLNRKARTWLDGLDPDAADVHLWMHYMDTHHPYEPAPSFMPHDDLEVVETRTEANNLSRRAVRTDGEGVSAAELRDVVRLYDAECASLDAELRSFVGWLESAGWLGADDLLVVTSDHGEVLDGWREWGVFGHENVFTEECTRVPLVVRGGGLDPVDVDGQASLVDLVPTLLDVLGVDGTERLMMGQSLVPLLDGAADGRESVHYDGTRGFGGVRAADGRKVFDCEHHGAGEYVQTRYGTAPTGYGDERDGDPAPDLLERVESHERRCAELAADSKGIDPDSLQVERHMRDLGYLE